MLAAWLVRTIEGEASENPVADCVGAVQVNEDAGEIDSVPQPLGELSQDAHRFWLLSRSGFSGCDYSVRLGV